MLVVVRISTPIKRRILHRASISVHGISRDLQPRALVRCNLKLKLIYDRQSVGQSALVSGTHLGPATNFSFSLKFSLDSCGFAIL
jgi:hypothetical protein